MATLETAVAPFRLTVITRAAVEAWKTHWKPINNRELPDGGWDWEAIRQEYRNDHKRFELAIWGENEELCGLAIGTRNKTAARLDAIEGSPSDSHPLKGQILLIGLQALSCYAQKTGRAEAWLMEPVEGLVEIYEQDFGFTLERPRKSAPYCRRRV
ncbi:hypothetical protein [Ferruginivarius sediminum]|nr:hypothetical protein [Ferruginivarius sediminum]